MRLGPLLALLLFSGSPAWAQEEPAPGGPVLGDLLRQPAYFLAWQSMLRGETPPDWLKTYTETLDGPPTPSIPVKIDDQDYLLAFTCKPNECDAFQLFVLFGPGGGEAWGLIASPLHGIDWLGKPDERIRAEITKALK